MTAASYSYFWKLLYYFENLKLFVNSNLKFNFRFILDNFSKKELGITKNVNFKFTIITRKKSISIHDNFPIFQIIMQVLLYNKVYIFMRSNTLLAFVKLSDSFQKIKLSYFEQRVIYYEENKVRNRWYIRNVTSSICNMLKSHLVAHVFMDLKRLMYWPFFLSYMQSENVTYTFSETFSC